MACIQNLQDEDGAGTEQAYLSVTWGKQCALHQISITALLISPRLLMRTSRFRVTFGCFFSHRQPAFGGECKHRLCAQGGSLASAWRQREIKEAAIFFCFFLVVSDQAVLEFLLGLLRRDMVRQTLFDESPVSKPKKQHFQGEKRNTILMSHVFLYFCILLLLLFAISHYPPFPQCLSAPIPKLLLSIKIQ